MNVPAGTHRYYCGIDLHARTMYVCILDTDGNKVYHKNIPCRPDRFLQAVEPFRQGLVVGVECIFCWQGLADLCQAEGIDSILGHALYMKAIHGVKTKNDRIDSLKVARLIRTQPPSTRTAPLDAAAAPGMYRCQAGGPFA